MNDEEKTVEPEQESARKPSRLGKEAKIGVAVIVVLLLVFVGVLVMRLSGAGSSDELALATDQTPDKAERPDADRNERHSAKLGAHKGHAEKAPTLVVAKPALATPPKPLDNDLDKWKLASDKGKAKAVEDHKPMLLSPPPSPKPPKPQPGNRYERSSSDPMAGFDFNDTSHGHRSADPGVTATGDSPRHQPNPVPRHDATPPARADASGFAAADSTPSSPPYRERNRYDDTPPPRSNPPLVNEDTTANPFRRYRHSRIRIGLTTTRRAA